MAQVHSGRLEQEHLGKGRPGKGKGGVVVMAGMEAAEERTSSHMRVQTLGAPRPLVDHQSHPLLLRLQGGGTRAPGPQRRFGTQRIVPAAAKQETLCFRLTQMSGYTWRYCQRKVCQCRQRLGQDQTDQRQVEKDPN